MGGKAQDPDGTSVPSKVQGDECQEDGVVSEE